MKNINFILASGSPRRKEILKDAGFKFKIIPPKISEKILSKKPSEIVKSLALRKAKSVLPAICYLLPATYIVGADTIVVLNGEIIGKPENPNEAVKILKKLSGSKHYVYTGIAILNTNTKRQIVDYEKTTVQFKKLSDKDIKNVSEKHLDKAGAYSIQEEDDIFVESIKGDYLNVVGFPLKRFKKMLKKL